MIHGVVVHERRHVDKFHHGPQGHRIFGGFPPDIASEEQQRGPKQLAGHVEQVGIDLLDHGEVRDRDPAQLLQHEVEAVFHGGLDPVQHCRRSLRNRRGVGHARAL